MTLLLVLAQELIDRRREAVEEYFQSPPAMFARYCAPCHGDEGRGDGRFWLNELQPSPPDISAGGDFIGVIREGKGYCPPWGRTLREDRLRALADYASRAPLPAPPDAPPIDPREPFPWAIAGVLAVELVLLFRLARSRPWATNESSSP